MDFEMSLAYETAMFAGVSVLHMSVQMTYSFYLILTEEWGTYCRAKQSWKENMWPEKIWQIGESK